jgi:hypothetical protein
MGMSGRCSHHHLAHQAVLRPDSACMDSSCKQASNLFGALDGLFQWS